MVAIAIKKYKQREIGLTFYFQQSIYISNDEF